MLCIGRDRRPDAIDFYEPAIVRKKELSTTRSATYLISRSRHAPATDNQLSQFSWRDAAAQHRRLSLLCRRCSRDCVTTASSDSVDRRDLRRTGRNASNHKATGERCDHIRAFERRSTSPRRPCSHRFLSAMDIPSRAAGRVLIAERKRPWNIYTGISWVCCLSSSV
jgi:hypothetical protein